jgi:lysophospholipase L1-like esterase
MAQARAGGQRERRAVVTSRRARGPLGLCVVAVIALTAAGRPLAQAVPPSPSAGPADRATPRTDQNSAIAHTQLLEKARAGGIDVYFVGDSITRRWGATDYPELLAHWRQNFFGWNAGNFGWGADRTENILWRLEHGELDGVNPKVIVIQAGTNNIGTQPGGAPSTLREPQGRPEQGRGATSSGQAPSTSSGQAAKVAEITRGLTAIVERCRQLAPRATVILTAIFPRNDNMAVMPEIDQVNANLARLADGRTVRYLSVNDRLADPDGRLFPGMMNERDKLHPTIRGYQVWADGLKPILTELLGPPASTDHAPPPTGDPSAPRR